MPRINVWIPDELDATLRARLPMINRSAVVQEALVGLLECDHRELVCARCATAVERRQLRDDALGEFFYDAFYAVADLAQRVGTAEGAARVLREVGQRHQIPVASRVALPRPTRAERLAKKVTPLPTEADSRERHPTARSKPA